MLVFISVFTTGCKIVWLPTLGLLESIHLFVGAGDGGVILSLIIREDWRIHKIAKWQMPDNGISQKFTFFPNHILLKTGNFKTWNCTLISPTCSKILQTSYWLVLPFLKPHDYFENVYREVCGSDRCDAK